MPPCKDKQRGKPAPEHQITASTTNESRVTNKSWGSGGVMENKSKHLKLRNISHLS